MTIAPASAAPAELAPNSTARQAARRDEIHTPEAEYNAAVPMAEIERDPANRVPAPEAVAAMAAAIEAEGLLQPIVLRTMEPGRYQIIAGEHRWSACKALGWLTIPARIYRSEDDLSAARKALLENNAREGLTAIDRARRFKQLEELGMKQKEIGALAGGLSQPVVANSLRLLELPAEVQGMLNRGELSEAHGVNLARWSAWPRACIRIAEMARDHGYAAKDLINDGVPFTGELCDQGLLERIQIKERGYWSDQPTYKVPRHFGSHWDFLKVGEFYVFYFVPADPKDNVWAPLKAQQDAEREQKAAATQAREAEQAAKNGGRSAEAIERAKTIAKNKVIRHENAAALQAAIGNLKRTPAPTALLVAILVEAAIAGGFGAKRIIAAAGELGVKLPKGLVSDQGGFGMRHVELMREMDVMELTRVAVAVLLAKEVDDANRNAQATPANVEKVRDAVVPPANFGVGDIVEWESGGAMKRGTVITIADFEKESGTKWPKDWTKRSTPVRLQKPTSMDCPQNGIATDGLRLVKASAPAELVKRSPTAAGPATKAAKKKGRK